MEWRTLERWELGEGAETALVGRVKGQWGMRREGWGLEVVWSYGKESWEMTVVARGGEGGRGLREEKVTPGV